MLEKKCMFWPVDEWSLCTMCESTHGMCTPLTDEVIIDNDTDEIKVISTQIIHLEIPTTSSVGIDSVLETPEEENRRKRINRIVGFFASLIFFTCVALVCSSLMMSKNIDELGKWSLCI
jgi:hypothetical protein